MTNSTSTSKTNSTNSTNQGNTMNTEINHNALSTSLASQVYHLLSDGQQNPVNAIVTACALTDAMDIIQTMGMPTLFTKIVQTQIDEAQVRISTWTTNDFGATVKTSTSKEHNLDLTDIITILKDRGFINTDGSAGKQLLDIVDRRKEAYAPALACDGVVRLNRNYGLENGQTSNLLDECMRAQEDTKFTVDSYILEVANLVQVQLGGTEKDDESYVLSGCNKMDSELAYVSEFKADRRLRTYQAACHGPNGQSSDRSRALMDLHGVQYDSSQVDMITKLIKEEVLDMVNVDKSEISALIKIAVNSPVDFILSQLKLAKKDRQVAKPWSFLKASKTLAELAIGNMPYIGMAVGLDAKCSGPQYGAIMSGDMEIAKACGLSLDKVEDAYHGAIHKLRQAGFKLSMSDRNNIKKSFMGIFYGQGWSAFKNIPELKANEQHFIVDMLKGEDGKISEEVAKRFHGAITKSFGKKMQAVRTRFSSFNGLTSGRITHSMPDGAEVRMNYKVKLNVIGEVVVAGTSCPDVEVTTSNTTYRFSKYTQATRLVNADEFIRNGFVNMIQATDALVARLIIVHAKRLGATHIVGIHDCFRVNVTEMPILKQAIINAYQDLFGAESSTDLPLGQDILAMYFEGANKAVMDSSTTVTPITQFIKVGKTEYRKFSSIGNVSLTDIFNKLGESYYFDK